MVPPKRLPTDTGDIEAKIKDAFTADFWAQIKRGLQGVWLAHKELAPIAQALKAEAHTILTTDKPNIDDVDLSHDKVFVESQLWFVRSVVTFLPQVCVTDLENVVCSEKDLRRNLADALQYLASYLCGTGSVGITAHFPDGARVRLMEDAATLVSRFG